MRSARTRYREGDVLGGKFLIIRELGSGGMGVVYEVQHNITLHRRALKLVLVSERSLSDTADTDLDSESANARLLREASAAGRIGNPHIVETFDAGVLPSGETYVVMELLEGESLTDLLKRRGKLPVDEAADLVSQTCEGLEAAHNAGIIHRDLKPGNLWVTERDGRPFVKILDFGISKFDSALTEATDLTREGMIVGTPYYMAPEQLDRRPADPRSDVYALGVILYLAMTGQRPFGGTTFMEMVMRVARGERTPILSLRPDIPTEFAAIVDRAMAAHRDERTPSAATLAEALAPFTGRGRRLPTALPISAGAHVPQIVPDLDLVVPPPSRRQVAPAPSSKPVLPPVALAPAVSNAFDDDDEIPESGLNIDMPAPREAPPPVSSRPSLPGQSTSRPSLSGPASVSRPSLGGPRVTSHPSSPSSLSRASLEPAVTQHQSLWAATRSAPPRRVLAIGGGALGLVVLVASLVASSAYARSSVLASAKARGFAVSVATVDVHAGSLTLHGITAEFPNAANLSLKAPAAEVELGERGRVSLATFELTASGNVGDVAAPVGAWRGGSHAPTTLEGKAGHVVWSDFLVAGGKLEATSAVLAMKDDTLTLDLPTMSVSLPQGTVGGWKGHLDSSPDETKLLIWFDHAHAEGAPNVTVLFRSALGVAVNVVVAKTPVAHLGIPTSMSSPETTLELNLSAQIVPGGELVTGHVALGLDPVSIDGAPALMNVEGNVSGDPKRPLHIEGGRLVLGGVSSRISGFMTVEDGGLTFELDRPSPRTGDLLPPLLFDTRTWTAVKGPVPPSLTPAPAPPTSSPPLKKEAPKPGRRR